MNGLLLAGPTASLQVLGRAPTHAAWVQQATR